MHVLIAVLGILGAGACWWCRVHYLAKTAGEVVDTAQRLRGVYRRKQFKRKADASTIDAIDDPRTAATVLLVAMASADAAISSAEEAAIRDAMRTIMAVKKPEEELIFAKWAAADVVDLNSLIARLSRVWTAKLDAAERRQLYDVAKKIAALENEPDDLMLSALQRLKDRLILQA
jgi:uncharacterized tellurite resistance protein B-like protein